MKKISVLLNNTEIINIKILSSCKHFYFRIYLSFPMNFSYERE